MPRYKIQSPDGRIVTVEGNSPPQENDLDQIFSQLPPMPTQEESIPEQQTPIAPEVKPETTTKEDIMATVGPEGVLGKAYAGLRMGIGKKRGARPEKIKKEILKGKEIGITAGEIGAGIAAPALSPLIVGAGETIRGQLKGEELPKAAIRGGKAAVIDVALLGLGKGLGRMGKSILRKSISPQFSEPITEKVLKDISLTAPTKKSFEGLGKKTMGSVKQLDRVFGKLVGKSKKAAIKAGETININPVKKEAIKLIRSEKLGGLRKLGKVKGVDSPNMNILKGVTKQLNRSKMGIDDAFTSLKNMDQKLLKTYQRQATPGVQLSQAEKTALRIRGIFKETLDNSVDKSFSKSKQPFIKLRKLLGENRGELGKKLKSEDDIFNTLKTAMTEKDVPMFRRLTEIDNLLPKNKKFLDDVIQKYTREAMTPKRIFPRRFEDIADMLALGTTKAMRGGKKIAPATRALSVLGASKAAQL